MQKNKQGLPTQHNHFRWTSSCGQQKNASTLIFIVQYQQTGNESSDSVWVIECYAASSWHSETHPWLCYEGDPFRVRDSSCRQLSSLGAHDACGRPCIASLFLGHDGWSCAEDPPLLLRRICRRSLDPPSRSLAHGVHHNIDQHVPANRKWN